MPKPPLRLEVSTLWEYPSQHYASASGITEQGDRDYIGATPSWLIWQLLRRYTHPGDVVVDPMCGSGTTLDVCRDLDRRGFGYDLAPAREDIRKADARRLPIDDESVDFVFLDPPYSTHVNYSDDPRCIGKLDAGGDDRGLRYFQAMEQVIFECARILKPDRCMGLYVSDSYHKGTGHHARSPRGTLIPLGFELFRLLRRHFAPVDIVCVVRHNRKLDQGNFRRAAEEENFFLRGFNYLFIMRKPKRVAAASDGGERRFERAPGARPTGRGTGRSSDRAGGRGGERGTARMGSGAGAGSGARAGGRTGGPATGNGRESHPGGERARGSAGGPGGSPGEGRLEGQGGTAGRRPRDADQRPTGESRSGERAPRKGPARGRETKARRNPRRDR